MTKVKQVFAGLTRESENNKTIQIEAINCSASSLAYAFIEKKIQELTVLPSLINP